jgi:hypothetical protein
LSSHRGFSSYQTRPSSSLPLHSFIHSSRTSSLLCFVLSALFCPLCFVLFWLCLSLLQNQAKLSKTNLAMPTRSGYRSIPYSIRKCHTVGTSPARIVHAEFRPRAGECDVSSRCHPAQRDSFSRQLSGPNHPHQHKHRVSKHAALALRNARK